METYNKLVRDKIPDIIEQDNKIPKIRILSDTEYQFLLLKKLVEESNEALMEKDNREGLIKELGDLLEVIDATIKAFGFDQNEILAFKNKRRLERGGFEKKIFLETAS